MSKTKYWLWLSSQEKVSPRAKAALVEHYGDAEAAFLAPAGQFASIPGLSPGEAEVLEKRDISRSDRILADCDAQNIRIIAIGDGDYPLRLQSIPAPPVVLYVKGRLPQVDELPAIAVIGTRQASPYGLKMGKRIAYEIVKSGGVVISGLTSGIDSAAARGALLGGGICIGVLGTAHGDRESNLQRDVAACGALVSEYPPGMRSQKSFFRERNRLASGLSAGVVVVEAPPGSGALLFAAEAQEQGREIFAVPGNADSDNSVGTIELLKDGAKPVTCGWDVMEDFQAMFPVKLSNEIAPPCPPDDASEKPVEPKKMPRAAKKDIDKKNDTGYIDLTKQLSELSEEQLKIVTAINKGGTHIDDIIEYTGLGTAKVLSHLTILEIKGYIRRNPGMQIVLNTAMK